MNRKARRGVARQGPVAGSSGSAAAFSMAVQCLTSGRVAEAQALCKDILDREPAHAAALNLLGGMAHEAGRFQVAIKLLRQAVAADGRSATFHFNLGRALQGAGRPDEARSAFEQALAIGFDVAESEVLQNPAPAAALQRVAEAWPRRLPFEALLDPALAAALLADPLLLALMAARPICDLALERLLTELRRAMAEAPERFTGDRLAFVCAMAQQCFINEYAFAASAAELTRASSLHTALCDGALPPAEAAAALAVVASYLPLHTLAEADRLADRDWPVATQAVIRQQLLEPREEQGDAVASLTPIDDLVSVQVQEQYESNPYPRWASAAPVGPLGLAALIRDQAHLPALPDALPEPRAILIAGCGTGRQSIETARRFPQASVLAIDLSRASLAYARRKSREAGLRHIDYAQADLLRLAESGRRFDLIEAVGVLHHLADPFAGWRVLLSVLEPRGVMRIGLYSALARRGLDAARRVIAQQSYPATPDGIRACRQDLISRRLVPPFTDFFSTSACRDLLFHVMEHRLTLPEIEAFLTEEGLQVLGLSSDRTAVDQFTGRYGDAALCDLGHWHRFEQDNPSTFSAMYTLWLRKAG